MPTVEPHHVLRDMKTSFGFQQLAAFQFGLLAITQPLVVVSNTHRHRERVVLYILVEFADAL